VKCLTCDHPGAITIRIRVSQPQTPVAERWVSLCEDCLYRAGAIHGVDLLTTVVAGVESAIHREQTAHDRRTAEMHTMGLSALSHLCREAGS